MLIKPFAPFRKERLGQGLTEQLLDDRNGLFERIPHEQTDRAIDIEIDAKLTERLDQRLVRQPLAVDEHAIAIEYRKLPAQILTLP